MECKRLSLFLSANWRDDQQLSEDIAEHIRTCPSCQRGWIRLVRDLEPCAVLSCEECLLRLPDYYEATHPEYPLVKMPAREIAQVAYHLSQCATCNREYQELARLWRLEEQDEIS